MPIEVFLSHSTEDFEVASRLAEYLGRRQVVTFFAPRSIQRALWHDEIGAALMRCDWFLLILSPAAITSKWVHRELIFALEEERLRERIIPIVWEPCEYDRLSWTLRSYQRVDIHVDFELGAEELLRRLGVAAPK